ncbi:MAG TPA: inositol monophosphatase family protein [Pyrinomonadaceae bacterium]|nr:inositol monophosphatase family protein [Pyrinomonadaceae bacterium]
MKSELNELLQFAVELGRGAGKITLEYFRKKPETNTKSDGSYVTIADRKAESYLRAQIAKRFPDDGVLGEEEGELPGRSGRRWIVDPIDGTFAFVHGVPFYGVLIALEIEGESSVGVVNIPALGEIVSAAKGLGCFLNGEPARVSSTAELRDALLLCTDFTACARYGFGRAAELLQERAKTSRTWGDCYGYVLVATGRADVMLDPIMNLWDCAPLLPIMEEAGGTFTDWNGVRTIASENSIATNGVLFDEVMRLVAADERG